MKAWKSKEWQLESTGVDGNALLFGVNIFAYKWVDTKRQAEVKGLSYPIPIYQVTIDETVYEFVADEASNCVWNFYVFKY